MTLWSAHRLACAASAALTVAVPVPSAASDAAVPISDAVPAEASEAPDDAIIPPATIVIAKPVGRVRLARTGDYLGVRGAEARIVGPNAQTTLAGQNQSLLSGMPFAGIPVGLPLQNAHLTSGFGYRVHPISGRYQPHRGIDLAAPLGTPVRATADGIIQAASWLGGYGFTIVLDHGEDLETRYAHLSAFAVSQGQFVKQGQIIGFVGSTGRSTGPHLHYEIRHAGVAVDPMN